MSRARRRPLIALVLATALSLGACSGSGKGDNGGRDGAASDPTNVDACQVMKKPDVEAVVGTQVADGVDPLPLKVVPPIDVVGMRFCFFNSVRPGDPMVYVGISKAYPREVFEKYKGDQSKRLTPVPNLGSDAVWSQFGPSGNLVALGVETVVGVSVSFVSKNPQEAAVALATTALQRS